MNKKILIDRVQYGSSALEYTVVWSKRIKTSEIIVDRANIEVRVPSIKAIQDVRKLVLGKARWIIEKQNEFEKAMPDIIRPTFKRNSTLPFAGSNYPLVIHDMQPTNKFVFSDGQFFAKISCRFTDNDESRRLIRELYEDWLKLTAKPMIHSIVESYSRVLGVNTSAITIKKLHNRWGSLSHKRGINISIDLIKAPKDILEYIVLHELCHFKLKEHSYRYWNLLREYMPDYETKIKWLEVNGRDILS